MSDTAKVSTFPVLPLRDIVVFPHMIVPLFVGRDKSVKALEDVMQDDKQIYWLRKKMPARTTPPRKIFTMWVRLVQFFSC